MKVSLVFIFIVAALTCSCKKKGSSTNNGFVYTGTILERICGDIVVESLSPAPLGQDTWVDSNHSAYPVVHHVFQVKDPCNFSMEGMTDTFHFQVVGTQVQNCLSCMAALQYMPDSAYFIKVIP